MDWDDLLEALVAFVGRPVQAQVSRRRALDPSGLSVVSTTFGRFDGSLAELERALGDDVLLLKLAGEGDTLAGVLSVAKDAFQDARRVDPGRLEILLDGVVIGIYAVP